MALHLINKLTNFLMPVEEEESMETNDVTPLHRERRPNLRLHHTTAAPAASTQMKVMVVSPTTFDEVRVFADYLKNSMAVVVNFQNLDLAAQQRVLDFLNGVCYVVNGSAQRVSEEVFLYVPPNMTIDKELYAYSVPTYVKTPKLEF